jgi:hypothetical protein
VVNRTGLVSLAGKQVLAAEILGGRAVLVRIEPQTLMFLDPTTRELLRVRPNPLTCGQTLRLQGARPAGPPPRPRTEPVTLQRTVSATGRIVVCRQPVSLGRIHAGRVLTIHVSSTRSRSSSTTRPEPFAAPPADPSSSSKPTARTDPKRRQRNSLPVARRPITNKKKSRR